MNAKNVNSAPCRSYTYFGVLKMKLIISGSPLQPVSALRYPVEGNRTIEYEGEVRFPVNAVLAKTMKKDETGEFLHYFMRSVKYKVQEARTREIREDDESVPFDGTAEDDGSPAGREASKLPGPDEETDSLMELETLFDAIEKEFRKKQDRVRPYLSALISVRLYDAIKQFGFRKRYTFMNMPIIRDAMKNRGRVPSQKETAALFNRLEEDASRAINTFFTRLQQDPAVKKLAISKKINPCGT